MEWLVFICSTSECPKCIIYASPVPVSNSFFPRGPVVGDPFGFAQDRPVGTIRAPKFRPRDLFLASPSEGQRRQTKIGQCRAGRGERNGQEPRPDDFSRGDPADPAEAAHGTDAHDAAGDHMGGADRNAKMRGEKERARSGGAGAEPLGRADLGDLRAHGAHDSPPAESGAE